MDVNGVIEYDEFVPVATKILNASPQSSVFLRADFKRRLEPSAMCRELLTTTDANRDGVIEYDELGVPVATEILMEILMATQLKCSVKQIDAPPDPGTVSV